jgi:hypothetical protein
MVGPDAHFLADGEFGIVFAGVGKDAVFLGDAGDLPLLGITLVRVVRSCMIRGIDTYTGVVFGTGGR